MKFIDLFAGLGSFHHGFTKAGYECVFASEINSDLRKLYKLNHGMNANGDITKINEKDIPPHDVICAGFPCQPFSLAGQKKGAKCPASGKLIDHVHRIAKHHNPKFILLENVPNVLTIEDGKFWKYIQSKFDEIGYQFKYKIMTPIDFGIPQNRKRVFIVGSKEPGVLDNFQWPNMNISCPKLSEILDSKLPHKVLEERKIIQINKWQELLDNLSQNKLPSISLVAPEFGANYPLDFSEMRLKDLKKFKGAYGADLSKCNTWSQASEMLPSYSTKQRKVSDWLKKSVLYSRNVYKDNIPFICDWGKGFDKEFNSWQILEWRGQSDNMNIFEHLIQFRASGLRVSKMNIAPSLIAMTPTQIPVLPAQMRYISHHEAAKLQDLFELKLPSERTSAFKALGNAVNAKIVHAIASQMTKTTKGVPA